ncbi:MAG TPA: hypothetical protein VK400_11260 [Pyrinomonadaceae bacterium]|nr:hypothetical protein [Pyrinomonadaceae bacterium]
MSNKLGSFLFICLLGFQFGCQIGQTPANIPGCDDKHAAEADISEGCDDKQAAETNISDEEIRLLFIESGLGEGDGKLAELMTFPKERIAAVVRKLKENGIARGEEGFQTEYHSEDVKVKSAYFLRSLGVDTAANEKYIVEATKNKDSSKKFNALSYLEIIISEGKKEYLPIVFEAAPQADGAHAIEMRFLFVYELENSPKIFLDYLSKQPLTNRKSVYELVSHSDEAVREKTLEKINANVGKFKEDKELKIIAAEFLREVGKRR